MASGTPAPAGRLPLLLVVLHRFGRADFSVVGVEPKLLTSPALTQQIPAAIEFDLHLAQPVPVSLQRLGIGAVRLLATAQILLLPHEPLDPGGDALVTHRRILRCVPIAPPLLGG